MRCARALAPESARAAVLGLALSFVPACSAGNAAAPSWAVEDPLTLGAGDAETVDPCADAGDRGDGSTFTDLYRDFFGPTGVASCSRRSLCHVPGGKGALNSGGYVCVPDQSTCWAAMTGSIVPDGGSPTPEQTTMYKALRKAPPTGGSGPMPFQSSFAFCPNDLQRISAWISAGAANN